MLTMKQQGPLLKAMFLLFLLQLGLKISILGLKISTILKLPP